MKVKLLILIVFVGLSPRYVTGQNSKAGVAIYNIGLSSVFSGIGALINNSANEKWSKVLLKGMGQGVVGGYLIYESKNLAGDIAEKQSWKYSWYAKFVNSAGVSIVENASSNMNFWEKWHVNFGFNRIELSTKDKFKVKYRIMPVSLALTISAAMKDKFEFKQTLQFGEIVFSNKNTTVQGTAYGNIISIYQNTSSKNPTFQPWGVPIPIQSLYKYDSFSHEIIHVYQYYDYNFVNTYLNKVYKNLGNRSSFFFRLNKIFYFDFQEVVLHPLYLLENRDRQCYYDNFFEHEAGFYSNTISCVAH